MPTRDEYLRWWATPNQDINPIPPSIALTLMLHVEALTSVIDSLPDEYRCACAYDYPSDVCSTHRGNI